MGERWRSKNDFQSFHLLTTARRSCCSLKPVNTLATDSLYSIVKYFNVHFQQNVSIITDFLCYITVYETKNKTSQISFFLFFCKQPHIKLASLTTNVTGATPTRRGFISSLSPVFSIKFFVVSPLILVHQQKAWLLQRVCSVNASWMHHSCVYSRQASLSGEQDGYTVERSLCWSLSACVMFTSPLSFRCSCFSATGTKNYSSYLGGKAKYGFQKWVKLCLTAAAEVEAEHKYITCYSLPAGADRDAWALNSPLDHVSVKFVSFFLLTATK